MTAYRKTLNDELLDAVLRWVLRCAAGDEKAAPPIASPLPDDDWRPLLDMVKSELIATLLQGAIRAGLPTTDDQAAEATQAARASAMTDLLIERALRDVAILLDDAGIRWRLIKGLAASRLLYRDAAQRHTGDVDLLVEPDDYLQAIDVLWDAEEIPSHYPAHGTASERHERGHTFVHSVGVEIDLHRHVVGPLSSYAIPTVSLFAAPQSLQIGGREVAAPATPVLILHAMLHLAVGPHPTALARLSTLADLVVARGRHGQSYAEALVLAGDTGNATPALWADRVVDEWMGPRAGQSTRRMPGTVWIYDRMIATPGLADTLQRFVGSERLRRAWEAAMPDEDYREANQRGVGGQLAYILRRFQR